MTPSRRDPPRWFVPALVGGMLLAVAALASLGTWLYDPPHGPIRIGERTFVIPPSALSSNTREPHVFIRIRPPDRPFEMVYDGRLADRRDGTGVPLIFSVNDHGGHDLRYGRDGRSLVVCRRASVPAGGCGTWISYGDANWSVLFAESQIGNADEFGREAAALLRRYDSRSSILIP